MSNTRQPVLTVENLSVAFSGRKGPATAVSGISFKVYPGEMMALVGESGCGKSVTAMSLLQLLPSPPAIIKGAVYLEERDLLRMSKTEIQSVRGKDIAMIFQNPMSSLNPVLTIERQLTEGIILHENVSRKNAIQQAKKNLNLVGITDSAERLAQYPHQLSGGMRQRVMIAMAISCNPKVLIADEPTTALDVTTQSQVLSLVTDIQKKLGVSTILITHDLGVVAETADRIAVMYFGFIVEQAPTEVLFDNPAHPYTKGLIAAVPRLDFFIEGKKIPERLVEIPGIVPSIFNAIQGCPFAPRCALANNQCNQEKPPEVELSPGHTVSCWEVSS